MLRRKAKWTIDALADESVYINKIKKYKYYGRSKGSCENKNRYQKLKMHGIYAPL